MEHKDDADWIKHCSMLEVDGIRRRDAHERHSVRKDMTSSMGMHRTRTNKWRRKLNQLTQIHLESDRYLKQCVRSCFHGFTLANLTLIPKSTVVVDGV